MVKEILKILDPNLAGGKEELQSFLDKIQKEAYNSGYENGFEDGENEAWANNYDIEGKYE